VYAEYNDDCAKVMATITTTGTLSMEDMARVVAIFEMLRLVRSKSVVAAALPVHVILHSLTDPQLPNPQSVAKSLESQFNHKQAALTIAMRTELGITD
jgi:phosphate/sulfate permease